MKHIVELNDLSEYEQAVDLFSELGCTKVSFIRQIATFTIECGVPFNADDYAIFKHSVPDSKVKTAFVPNDSMAASNMWHLARIKAHQAWDKTFGQGVTVAVVDSGTTPSHPDLVGNLLPGWCVVTETTDVTDINGHGTWVSGFIGATGNNQVGVIGVAPQVKLLPIRITNAADGDAWTSDMVKGLLYAADSDAQVVCMTSSMIGLTGDYFASTLDYLAARNKSLFNSAGNQGAGTLEVHGDQFTWCSGMNSSNQRMYNYGPGMDILAPGDGLSSTHKNGSYSTNSLGGTSFSAPITAGVAALIRSYYPDLSYKDVRRIICLSANKTLNVAWTPGWDSSNGWGCIDAEAALALAATWKRRDLRPPIASFSNLANSDVFLLGESGEVELVTLSTYGVVTSSKLFVNNVEVLSGVTLSTYTFTPGSVGLYTLRLEVRDDIEGLSVATVIVRVIAATLEVTIPSIALPLEKNATYEVRVRAKNGSGNGAWSSWEALAVNTLVPETPVLGGISYLTPGVASVRFGAVASAESFALSIDDVPAGAVYPGVAVEIPLTLDTQVIKIVPSSSSGAGPALEFNVEAMPLVVSELNVLYAVGTTSSSVSVDSIFSYTIEAASQEQQCTLASSSVVSQSAGVSILQRHLVELASGTSVCSTTAIAITQNHKVSLAATTETANLSSLAIKQTHQISLSDSVVSSIEAPLVTKQSHQVTIANTSIVSTSSSLSLSSDKALSVSNASTLVSSTPLSIIQSHKVSLASSAAASQSTSLDTTQTHKLSISSSEVSSQSSALSVVQGTTHLISMASAQQISVIGSVVLSQRHLVGINNALQPNSMSQLAIIRLQGAPATASSLARRIEVPPETRIHAIQAESRRIEVTDF